MTRRHGEAGEPQRGIEPPTSALPKAPIWDSLAPRDFSNFEASAYYGPKPEVRLSPRGTSRDATVAFRYSLWDEVDRLA